MGRRSRQPITLAKISLNYLRVQPGNRNTIFNRTFRHRTIVKPHSCGDEILANPDKESMHPTALASVNVIRIEHG
jgi:hypothetical protein